MRGNGVIDVDVGFNKAGTSAAATESTETNSSSEQLYYAQILSPVEAKLRITTYDETTLEASCDYASALIASNTFTMTALLVMRL